MIRITSFIITPFIILAAFTITHAQTAAELQAQLAALLQQLAALQAQLPSVGSGGGSTTPPPFVGGNLGQCPNLNRALRQGMSGSDVSALQVFLASDPSIYPEGTVSGYFGALTQAAVQRFQARRGIVSSGTPDSTGYGAVGPATRAAIASVCGQSVGYPVNPGVPGSGCSVAGLTLSSGATVQLYSVLQAPAGGTCASFAQTRQCVNGIMSGSPSYQYASCSTPVALSSCTVGDNVIPHGTTRTFYSQSTAAFGSSCSSYSQQRTCANGSMSGSSTHRYSSCSVRDANTCAVGNTIVNHNTSRTFYKKSLVAYGESCSVSTNALTRTCTNGTMSGDNAFDKPSCTSATSSSCTLDGFTIANNATKDFYSTRTAPYTTGTACPAQYKLTRKCVNGIFDGDENFKYATCSIGAGASCTTQDGSTIAHGQVRALYKQGSVAFGGSCGTAVNRTCTNGVLSGTGATLENIYSTCTVGTGNSCSTADNVSVPSGSTTPMYTTSSVPFGSTCTKVNRTCTNGSFGTTNTGYTFYRCSVGNAPTPTCTLQVDKPAYLPGQTVSVNWTSQNAISGFLVGGSTGVQLGATIPLANIGSGSRTNVISYGATGSYDLVLELNGNQNTVGACSAEVLVQNVQTPICDLKVQKVGSTVAPGTSVTINPNDSIKLTWTSQYATEYATSSSSVGLSATTSDSVTSGSRTIIAPRDTSYRYVFSNAGVPKCTKDVTVVYNPPTCTVPTPDKTAYIYGDDVKLFWSSTNADYATATSSDRVPLINTGVGTVFKNITQTTTYNITFVGTGGTKTCSKTITIAQPITVTSPLGGIYQPTNLLTIAWTYAAPPAGTKVRLDLIDLNNNVIGTIATNFAPNTSHDWQIPAQLNGTTLNGQYRIRVVGFTTTDKARNDSAVFTINAPGMGFLSNSQVAAALSALEALLKDALAKLGF